MISSGEIDRRARYQLLSSIVVPRPIGWISSRGEDGTPNLAPFSFFMGISATPMLVGVSIGLRKGEPKDTLRNIRSSGAFCVNLVTDRHLEAMNITSGEFLPEVDEFVEAGLELAEGTLVSAPYVADCPAVLECVLYREVELGEASSALLVGEVIGVSLREGLAFEEGTRCIHPQELRPVGRLNRDRYSILGEIREIPRPKGPGS